MKDIFLKLMFNIVKNYNGWPFLLERIKLEKLVANLHDKEECYTHERFKASIK